MSLHLLLSLGQHRCCNSLILVIEFGHSAIVVIKHSERKFTTSAGQLKVKINLWFSRSLPRRMPRWPCTARPRSRGSGTGSCRSWWAAPSTARTCSKKGRLNEKFIQFPRSHKMATFSPLIFTRTNMSIRWLGAAFLPSTPTIRVRILMTTKFSVLKDDNKWKRGRGWPILKKLKLPKLNSELRW